MLENLLDFLFETVPDFCFDTVPVAIEKTIEDIMKGVE